MTVYYNENDPRAAEWLRELMRADAIPEGVVDERSIEDIAPADLAGFRQCHFFAGIGGWPFALRMAGWPDSRPVWTGSCPCQPFSQAGARLGVHDPRHLWPVWRWLIDQSRPITVFGEQVAGPDGREWLAGVRADLDLLGYAFGAADLCAAGVGAPHVRQRHWWVAYREGERREWWPDDENEGRWQLASGHRCEGGWLADADGRNTGSEGLQRGREYGRESQNGRARIGLEHAQSDGREQGRAESVWRSPAGGRGEGGLRDAYDARREGRIVLPECSDERAPWAASLGNWVECDDGKVRRIEPGLEPLVNGLPGRVGLLRGYGNAIVPQVAALFIEAAVERTKWT